MDSWSQNDRAPVAPGEMVRNVIADFVQQRVNEMQRNLSVFAAQLQNNLSNVPPILAWRIFRAATNFNP